MTDTADAGKCPVVHAEPTRNRDWWPDQLDLGPLQQNPPAADPMGRTSTTRRNLLRSTWTRSSPTWRR